MGLLKAHLICQCTNQPLPHCLFHFLSFLLLLFLLLSKIHDVCCPTLTLPVLGWLCPLPNIWQWRTTSSQILFWSLCSSSTRLSKLAPTTKELNSWHTVDIRGPGIRGEEITHPAISLAQTFGTDSLQISLQC